MVLSSPMFQEGCWYKTIKSICLYTWALTFWELVHYKCIIIVCMINYILLWSISSPGSSYEQHFQIYVLLFVPALAAAARGPMRVRVPLRAVRFNPAAGPLPPVHLEWHGIAKYAEWHELAAVSSKNLWYVQVLQRCLETHLLTMEIIPTTSF